ncbi:MAG: leucine-rich repeat domain-containing protein [Muribaculaceae bacterium]|nr:leucine-rich repeat domain-containing protein [Muribaculaceae bacterium]
MIKRVFLSAVAVVMAIVGRAGDIFSYTYEGQTLKYEVIDDSTCMVSENKEITGAVIIPSKISLDGKTLTVTEIGRSAFILCKEITSVSIPSSIQKIGSFAFGWSDPWDEKMNKAEFESLESLCSIEFEHLNSNPLLRAKNLYINGVEIKDLEIPKSVTSIGNYALCGASDLTSVKIHKDVTNIGYGAFAFCEGLNKAVYESLEALLKINFEGVEANPLWYAGNLYFKDEPVVEVQIPADIKEIKKCMFSGAICLKKVEIPSGVERIGDYAFKQCQWLTNVDLPKTLREIGYGAFSGCTEFTSVQIPGSVYKILNGAFSDCTYLTEITLPNSLREIGYDVFEGCELIMTIYNEKVNPYECIGAPIFDDFVYEAAKLYVPTGSKDEYRWTDYWKRFKNIIEKDFGGVGEVTADVVEGPTDVYDLNGVRVGSSTKGLAKGMYIVRRGSTVTKVAIF